LRYLTIRSPSMRIQRSILLLILILSGAGIANAHPFLKVTISTRQDTVYSYPDSIWMQSYYHISDSLITITIENTAELPLKVNEGLCIGYPEDDFTDIYFNTWYMSGGMLKQYHGHSAHIDFVGYPDDTIPTMMLKPGEKLVLYKDPFGIYGYNDTPGLHKLQVVYDGYVSNTVSVFFAGMDTISGMDNESLEYNAGERYKDGQYYAAAAMYRELWGRDRYNDVWAYKRGMCGWSAGKYLDASNWLRSALNSEANNINYHLKYAEALYKAKYYGEAAEQYEEIVEKVRVLDSLKGYLVAQSKSSKQKQEEADAVDVSKLSSKAWDYERAEKFDSAIVIYNKIQQLDSINFYDYLSRAICYYKLNNVDRALKDLDTLIKRSPANAYARFYRSLVLEKQGKYPEACADMETALNSNRADYIKEQHAADIIRVKEHCK
jgi:tetratricopeptide (TPR) repeat protein